MDTVEVFCNQRCNFLPAFDFTIDGAADSVCMEARPLVYFITEVPEHFKICNG